MRHPVPNESVAIDPTPTFPAPAVCCGSTTTMPQTRPPGGPSGCVLGCGLRVAVEEVDLRSQHVGEACSAFVDVVVTTAAAEQFGTRCPAGDLERGRDGRNGVCLGENEQKGDTHGGSASHSSTPGEAEQRPRGHPVVPYRPAVRPNCPAPDCARNCRCGSGLRGRACRS